MLRTMAAEPDDTTLMLRYCAGEMSAFEVLYRRHRGPLYRYFLRQNRDSELAAELFQEVWIRIIGARHSYRPAARFTTYMYKIAHHCLIDHLRRAGRRPEDPDVKLPEDADMPPDPAGGPESDVLRDEVARALRGALATLPAEQGEAFLLHEEGNLSVAEIAEITGVPAETVKSRLRYALRKLRGVSAGLQEFQ